MAHSRSLKFRVAKILDLAEPDDTLSKFLDLFVLGLILLNTIAVALETVDPLFQQYFLEFRRFEQFTVSVFSIEYLLRLWSCTVIPKYRHPVWGRLKFMITPLAVIDLLAILPFFLSLYIPLFSPQFRMGRTVRLIRFFRVLKLHRYTDSLSILVRVYRIKKEELFLTFFVLIILLFISSTLIYFAEHTAQPEVFSSIPAAIWWGTITLTTVGYGDVYPITVLGRILGGSLAVLGIGLFALPAGILASGFAEELAVRKAQKRGRDVIICPHCGQDINSPPHYEETSESGEIETD
ncbi:ion transporter [Geitlerinema sp. P-1104]|uniref:ion transporter n=1 Tax=Geitlerinema sp. P-1104 TaxID=2546230 RepID=UPI0014770DBB|nr:ion transporter [Geitlerinema sp. P-1104]NMG58964.1 ion transporter [Geitlerinema sp. P-1104]